MAKKKVGKKSQDNYLEIGKKIISDKRVQWAVAIISFLIILFLSTNLRLGNLDIMKDSTTGKYTSNDLDSLYFYRIAETKLNNGGKLPEIDELRSPGYNVPWLRELLPDMLIWNYKFLKVFNSEITFDYACAISAPIFFAIGLVLFFIMALLLTKSKTASVVASAFLGFAPGFLFRSIAGFYDHDHVGVFALFALVSILYLGIKKFEKDYKSSVLWGVFVGFFTALVYNSWAGAITFVLVFMPVAYLIYYLFNSKDKLKFITHYLVMLVSTVIFVGILGMSSKGIAERFLDSQGLAILFVIGFALIDFGLELLLKKKKLFDEKYEKLASLGITGILGILGLMAIGKNPIDLFKKVWSTLIYPFYGDFSGRLGSTVAENAQPYLVDLISQNGEIIFWLFVLGLVVVAINFVKNSEKKENKIILSGSMALMFVAILFSRYSPSNLFDGENFLSQAFYLVGALAFVLGLGYVYSKERFKIDERYIVLFAMGITVVLNARAAVRSFFLITPFIALIASYPIAKIIEKICEKKENEKRE